MRAYIPAIWGSFMSSDFLSFAPTMVSVLTVAAGMLAGTCLCQACQQTPTLSLTWPADPERNGCFRETRTGQLNLIPWSKKKKKFFLMAISISQACDTSAVWNEFLRKCKAATVQFWHICVNLLGRGVGCKRFSDLNAVAVLCLSAVSSQWP